MKLSKSVIYVVVGVLVLGGLFLLFKPQNQTNYQQTTQTTTEKPSPTPISNVKTFELVLKDKKVVEGPETMTVKKNDEVVFKVTADRAGEFHLHGYDKDVVLEKDVQGELKITANLTGRFDIEFHESETNKYEVATLEVQPE